MNTNPQQDKASTISLKDEQAVKDVLTKTILTLWEAVNNLTRLRPSKRDRYRVTIFGSARAKPGTFVYDEVKRLAESLVAMDCDIVTGGGPGLMQAANEGAATTPERNRSVGIRVELPFEQEVNPFVELAFEHQTFFSRLHHFVLTSDAFIVTPGGIGTVLELTLIWQLLQVRHMNNVPLILVGKMWSEWIGWGRTYLQNANPPLVNAEDMDIPICVNTADEAIERLREFRARWRASPDG